MQRPRPFDDGLVALVRSAEVSLANLEAPVADQATPSAKSGPVLRLTAEQATAITGAGFRVLGLANNHLLDQGLEGLSSTLDFLRSAGVAAVGAGATEVEAYVPLHLEARGVKLAILAACEREFGAADEGRGGVAALDHPRFAAALRDARATADVVVVLAHGGVEASWVPPVHWADQLRRLTNEGADLVIGHHPHVVQGIERCGGGLVAYSLGDCYWPRSGAADDPRRALGLLLDVTFDGSRLESVSIRPIGLTGDHRVRLLDGQQETTALDLLERLSRLVADRAAANHAWDALAVRLFGERYRPRLFGASQGAVRMRDLARYGAVGVLNLREVLTGSDHSTLRQQLLFQLNLLQNPSHRDVCVRGLRALTRLAASPGAQGALDEVDAIEREVLALGRAVSQAGADVG